MNGLNIFTVAVVLIVLLLLILPLRSVVAQQRFHRQLPPGNYSAICCLGDDRYAVVSDKSEEDGFFIFRLTIDSAKCRITSAENLGFRSCGLPNRDIEGICYCPSQQAGGNASGHNGTLFISGEGDNEVYEYDLDGHRTGRRLAMPPEFKTALPNLGLESLTYDANAHLFYTTTERPLPGDTLLRIQSFGDDLQPRRQYLYKPDAPLSRKHFYGVSELLATGDGRLLVLERQLRVPRLKIGATATVNIYEVNIGAEQSESEETGRGEVHSVLEKRLVKSFRTRLNIIGWRFANYEGMCQPQPGLLLLIADSQGRYRGVLRDWLMLTDDVK